MHPPTQPRRRSSGRGLVQLARSSAAEKCRRIRSDAWFELISQVGAAAHRHLVAARSRPVEGDSPTACVKGIQDDIGETQLARAALRGQPEGEALQHPALFKFEACREAASRFCSGRAFSARSTPGPTLCLKGDQLEGRSWPQLCDHQRPLRCEACTDLLVEIAATGTAVFYVDAIDRIEKEHQPIVLDVLRTIIKSPLAQQSANRPVAA